MRKSKLLLTYLGAGGGVEKIAPTVVITFDEADPTIVSPFTARITFSEDVTGFATGDITVANGTKVTFATVSASVYTQTIVPNAGATVTVDVAAGVCKDLAGNDNTAATQVSVVSKVMVWDDFTDTATALNASAATPGPGTRTETDTGGKISTNGSALVFETGETANDAVWWGAVTRGYGALAVFAVTPSEVTNGIPNVGWDSAASGAILDSAKFAASSALQVIPNGGTAVVVGAYTAAAHYVAAVMKATGMYYFIKGGDFSAWTYIYQAAAGTGDGYPAVQASGTASVFTAPFVRAFKAGTYDVPLLAYDSFTQDNGALNGVNSDTTGPDGQTVTARAWTAAGGAISTNKLVITPTVGSDLWDAAAAAFTEGTYAWTVSGTNTLANVSNTLEITYVDNAAGAHVEFADAEDLSANLTVGAWYQLQLDTKVNAGATVSPTLTVAQSSNVTLNESATDFVTHLFTFRASSATANSLIVGNNMGAGEKAYVDNLSLKPITLSTCLSSLTDGATSSVSASANITCTNPGTINVLESGLVLCLDSAATPANFVLLYLLGNARLYCDKCIGGTYTQLAASGVTYSAGARLEAMTSVSGTNLIVRYYYNSLFVAEQTIADVAGALRTNTIHGLFSTSATNSFTNFELRAKTGYTGLDSFIA